jgi:hypothetical protein
MTKIFFPIYDKKFNSKGPISLKISPHMTKYSTFRRKFHSKEKIPIKGQNSPEIYPRYDGKLQ